MARHSTQRHRGKVEITSRLGRSGTRLKRLPLLLLLCKKELLQPNLVDALLLE